MKNLDKNLGFTLIELALVLVIIGILSSVIVPKLTNIQSDAKITKLKQIESAVITSNQTLTAALALPSFTPVMQNARVGAVDLDGDGSNETNLVWNYLDNNSVINSIELDDAMFHHETNWDKLYIGYDHDNDANLINDNCYFLYTQAAAQGSQPTYTLQTTGC